MMMRNSSVLSRGGALLREAGLHLSAQRPRRAGHTVLIFPSQGRDDGAANLRGYCVADYLNRHGWNAFVCPKHLDLAQRRRIVRTVRPDVILMQTARHPHNRPANFPGVPVVFDIDDADYLADHSRAAVDMAIQDSVAVIAGSEAVADYCRSLNDDVSVVWTGSPPSSHTPKPQAMRERIVTWAASGPLTYTAEAEFVAEALRLAVGRTAPFRFMLFSDDGSPAYDALVARFSGVGVEIIRHPYLAYADYLDALEEAAVGLAPLVAIDSFSGGKSFGKVLAYLDRGVPVVTHPVVDHPLFFRDGVNGFMADHAHEWADHIVTLLDDPALRQRLSDAGRADFLARLSTDEAGKRVEAVLRRLVA